MITGGWRQQKAPNTRLVAPSVAGSPSLDAVQERVVGHVGSPLLVLAGPGSGKTTTIVEAVLARLHGEGSCSADEVLVLTFSRTAAAELRARIAARLDGGAVPTVATFHAFAWQLLRQEADADTVPERLLSGPEQDMTVRELLADQEAAWRALWPESSREALESPALARELIGLMAATRAQGWEPARLAAEPDSPPEWPAAAAFFEEYLRILDWRRAVDYSEVVFRATMLIRTTPHLIGRYRAIYLDEYQDTDPAQVAMVAALTVPSTTLVAVGDPDQAIYRFRGADVGGIIDFPRTFPRPDGSPAPVEVLDRTRRFGAEIRAVADSWISPVGLGTLPASVQRSHRAPECDGPPGTVEVLVSDTPEQQAAAVADLLRRARLDETASLEWSDMAVLVRSGVADLPRLQQALLAAGVPVQVPPGERPLGREPALTGLITGLRLVREPSSVDYEEVATFLCSPLIGLTPLQVRRLMRALRADDRVAAAAEGRGARSSAELLRALLQPDAALPAAVPPDLAESLLDILETLDDARTPGLTVAERLWRLWAFGAGESEDAGGRWAAELRRRALSAGPGAHLADNALDCVVELFRLAERVPRGSGLGVFLDGLVSQQIPAARPEDGTGERDAVHLLTAHRAKGAQWPMVVVVGLQQDGWPDARSTTTLLQAERLSPTGLLPVRSRRELVEDERRLAFVAATRAQRRLVIATIDGGEGSDDTPSVLVDEAVRAAGGGVVRPVMSRGPRGRLTPASLVASLRQALADTDPEGIGRDVAGLSPDVDVAALRNAAAGFLADLADTSDGAPLTSLAEPANWWGVVSPSESTVPLADPARPLPLSATAVEAIAACPLRWFLQRRAQASVPRGVAPSAGSVVHAAAAAVLTHELPADLAEVAAAIRPVWDELPHAAPWEAERSWRGTEEAIARLLAWLAASPSVPVASEAGFDVEVTAAGRDCHLRGRIDMLDRDPDGAGIRVVDFKTGAPVTGPQAEASTQLGVYQLALELGGVEQVGPVAADGGVLLFVGSPARADSALPKALRQSPLADHDRVLDEIGAAAAVVDSEAVNPKPAPSMCRSCEMRPICPAFGDVEWIDTRSVDPSRGGSDV